MAGHALTQASKLGGILLLGVLAGCGGGVDSGPAVEFLYAGGDRVFPGGWSDDGRLVYATRNRGDEWAVVQIEVDTGTVTPVATGLGNAGVSAQQRGRLLLESVGVQSDIYLYDLGEGSLARLTETDSNEWHPSFHPNGREVVFDSDRSGPTGLYRSDEPGREPTRLSRPDSSEQVGRYSPDGSRLTFHRRVGDEPADYDVFVLDLRSGTEARLTETPGDDSYADWSPDGTLVVFSSNREASYDLYLACADGGFQERLTSTAQDEKYPRWAPSGDRILYQDGDGSALGLAILSVPKLPDCG